MLFNSLHFSDIKKTILSLAFLLATFWAVDRLGGWGMAWVQNHSNDLVAPKLRYMARTADPDILLLGTSRCLRHYVASTLTDSTGLTAYNGGIDGSNNIYAQYMALHLVLCHHTPRVVCLEVSEGDYLPTKGSAEFTALFAPYIGRSPQIDSLFRQLGTYWPYRISHLYRYNAKAVSNLAGLLSTDSPLRADGFAAVDGPTHRPDSLIAEPTIRRLSRAKLHLLETFIADCRTRGIVPVMMISPAYSRVEPDFYLPLHRLADRQGVPLLDYHTSGLFHDRRELFYDNAHLNTRGAEAFTVLFAGDLKRVLEGSL